MVWVSMLRLGVFSSAVVLDLWQWCMMLRDSICLNANNRRISEMQPLFSLCVFEKYTTNSILEYGKISKSNNK